MQKVSNFQEKLDAFRKQRIVSDTIEYTLIAVFLLPYAVAVNQLLVPHNIVGGGLTGISEILYFATDRFIPIWLTSLTVNVILLIVAIMTIGWQFCVRTIWGVLWLAFWLKLIPIGEQPMLSDPFMSCVIAGLFCGASLGVVYLNNGSSGGTDIIAMIVNKYRRVSIGRTLFLCDLVIICSAWFLPNIKGVEPIFMGLCFTFMCMVAVDSVLNNARQSVQFMIFSMKHSDEIADAINTRAHRGVTILNGMGWYLKKPIKVVTVLARKHESKQIFDIIKAIDPNAFVSQTNAQGVFGKGFDTVLNKREQELARQIEEKEKTEE
ncbi:MAG: YitT family protein [Paludibacteraceae bacterium]|nr:YitT family protein [Paludibacteraceae bacterium]